MFLFFSIHYCSQNFSLIENTIKTLHETTNFSTIYEMFNVPEHASQKAITSAFRSQLRTTKNEKLLFDAYNILTKDRVSHDYYLKYSTFPQRTNTKVCYTLFGIFLVLCADLGFMVYRIQNQKISRKKKGKQSISIREMYSVKMLLRAKEMVFGY